MAKTTTPPEPRSAMLKTKSGKPPICTLTARAKAAGSLVAARETQTSRKTPNLRLPIPERRRKLQKQTGLRHDKSMCARCLVFASAAPPRTLVSEGSAIGRTGRERSSRFIIVHECARPEPCPNIVFPARTDARHIPIERKTSRDTPLGIRVQVTMKIAYICSDREVPVLGAEGSSMHVREVAGALARIGHEVFMLASWLGGKAEPEFAVPCYELKPVGMNGVAWEAIGNEPLVERERLYRDLSSVFFNSVLQTEGAELLLREAPDFIYERYSLFGWAGVQLSRRFNIPLILEVNTPLCQEQDGYDLFTLTHTARRMENRVLREADVIITVCDWLKKWIVQEGAAPEKIHVIPNGVSARKFSPAFSGEAIRRQYSLIDKRVIGIVSSFQPWQDTTGLLTAFYDLYRDDPDLRLLLVGEGEQTPAARKWVTSKGLTGAVIFTGEVRHDRVPEYIAAMDLTVAPYVPSRLYGSPMKVSEYMAAGKPTVVTRFAQIDAIVKHGENGWLYSPSDPAGLVTGLRILLYDTALAARMGTAARSTILAEHTWERVAEKIVGLAAAAISSKP